MFKVCAFIKDDVSAEYSEFQAAFGITDSGDSGGGEEEPDEPVTPEVTLTSISATYSGGDVTVGTAVADLTGLVVTAHYSDGSQQNVTGYTLSGEIAEGENTITVSYGGKTTTFTVTGVAESGGEETGVSNETTWTNGVPYTFTPIADSYPDKSTGALETYASWERSPYLYCAGASTLRGVVVATGNFSGTKDNAFYDADKKFISYSTGTDGFRFDSLNGKESGAYFDVAIPENAAYFMVSAGYKLMSEGKIQYVPYE